jgi:DNA-binding transcriptional LysR family regulator
MHISQPALTLAINKLERELKTALLIRARRKLELTDAGRVVYAAATEHQTTNENLLTNLVELTRQRPKIIIGMIDSIAAAFSATAQPLDRLEEQADVSIVVNNSRYLREAVKSRQLSLAFVVLDSLTHSGLDIEPIGVEPLVLVCRPDYLPAAVAGLENGELSQFVSYDLQSTSYSHISQRLQQLDITIAPTFYSTSPDVILRMVLRGKRVAALPYLVVRELLQTGNLTILSKNGQNIMIERPIGLVTVRGKILPKAVEDFSKRARLTLDAIRQEAKATSA